MMVIPCLCLSRFSSCTATTKKYPDQRSGGIFLGRHSYALGTLTESDGWCLYGLRLLIFPQPLGRALKNQNAAPASAPCFRRRRRSPPLLFESCTATTKKVPRPFGLGTRGGALSAAVEPLGRHIVAAVRALQTKKRRHFGTLQPLLVCFFQLIFVQGNAVQQITLILGGCIVIDAEPFADCTELVKHFNSSRGHSFDFNIHRSTTFQERYILKRESAALSAIISMIGPPDCLEKT